MAKEKYLMVLKELHETLAVFSVKENYYEIIANKKNYFDELPQKGELSLFVNHEKTKNPNIKNKILKRKLNISNENISLENRLTINFNLTNKDGKANKIRVEVIQIEDDYVYLVDVIEHIEEYCKKKFSENEIKTLEEREEFAKVALTLSNTALFKLDFQNKHILFYDNNNICLDNKYITLSLDEFIRNQVFEEDIEIFNEMIDSIKNGIEKVFKLRLKVSKENEMSWHKISYDIKYLENGQMCSVIAQIVDISNEVKYKIKAERDLLTDCYNKETTKSIIEELLEESTINQNHYLILVDVDNFKAVNDNLGHKFGDIVLKDLAKKLKRVFREDDIIGRIGGDEFLVFIQNIEENILKEKLDKVVDGFRNIYSDNHAEYGISSSVGVSKFLEHGETFEELYVSADSAMYHAKKNGKDKFCIFSDNMEVSQELHTTHFDTMQRGVSQFIDIKTCFSIFDLLYQHKDLSTGIKNALSLIGKKYNIDRCFIFETSQNATIFSKTYSWANDGIEDMKDHEVIKMGLSEWQPLIDLYDENGIYYFNGIENIPEDIRKTLKKQNVESMLQCAFSQEGEIKMIIGFDNCSKHKKWNIKLINTLVFLSKIIAIYVYRRQVWDSLD